MGAAVSFVLRGAEAYPSLLRKEKVSHRRPVLVFLSDPHFRPLLTFDFSGENCIFPVPSGGILVPDKRALSPAREPLFSWVNW